MRLLIFVAAAGFGVSSAALADSVSLVADRDNTLFEVSSINSPQTSDGAGQFFFTGRVAPNGGSVLRRGLVHFDVSSIPANATIDSATLRLNCSKTIVGAFSVELHPVQADWGEGTSDAGVNEGTGVAATANDATWFYRFFNTATWTNPGGDFSAASAAQTVNGVGAYQWSSTQMAADVAGWVSQPASNFGWLVLDVETPSVTTAKRFDSRSSPTMANRPALTVNYTVPPPMGACCNTPAPCAITDSNTCAGQGGSFKGAGSVCGTQANPTTCCKANFNGVGGLTVQDIFDFLTAYFAGLPSADFNGVGGVTVQDIFDFLKAFFAGCTVS